MIFNVTQKYDNLAYILLQLRDTTSEIEKFALNKRKPKQDQSTTNVLDYYVQVIISLAHSSTSKQT